MIGLINRLLYIIYNNSHVPVKSNTNIRKKTQTYFNYYYYYLLNT